MEVKEQAIRWAVNQVLNRIGGIMSLITLYKSLLTFFSKFKLFSNLMIF
jgi:hypothetical protein